MQSTATVNGRKSRKVEFSCELVQATIRISGVLYTVEPIAPGEDGTAAFRLQKQAGDGAIYDVIRRHDGLVACDCPHYTARIEGLSCDCCKHGLALVELGLIEAPEPIVEPTPCCDPAEAVQCVTCATVATIAIDSTVAVEGSSETKPEPCEDPLLAEVGDDPWPDATVVGIPADAEGRLSMLEVVELEAQHYRSLGTAVGSLMAAHMAELASEIRILHANDVRTFYDRRSAYLANRAAINGQVRELAEGFALPA
jgi:hypothetical protein